MTARIVILGIIGIAGIAAMPAPCQTTAQTTATHSPRFSDYPAVVYHGAKPPLRLTRRQMGLVTRYRNLYREPANFAGHFAVGFFGCGAGCLTPIAVDLSSGRAVEFDAPTGFEGDTECDPAYRDSHGDSIEMEWYYKPDSRLLVIPGPMAGDTCGILYYREVDGRLQLIMTTMLKKAP